MKNIIASLFLIVLGLLSGNTYAQDEFYHTVVSYNIRYDNKNDINPWILRKQAVADQITTSEAGIAGLQEALHNQIEDLSSLLPSYKWVGVGRDDGKQAGEYCPIFYDTIHYKMAGHGTFWLSETSEEPSRGWDAACNRIVTWAIFTSRANNEEFIVFNTHFDHEGKKARQRSVEVLRMYLEELAGPYPAIVMGDFNAEPKSKTYKKLTKKRGVPQLSDPVESQEDLRVGDLTTYCGFEASKCARKRIDYIFTKGDMHVRLYVSVWSTFSGLLPSDHLPVIMEFKLKATN